jgi:hypothetical protein
MVVRRSTFSEPIGPGLATFSGQPAFAPTATAKKAAISAEAIAL